jgi:3-mercaptopyruvate sulfurtransferase SseA
MSQRARRRRERRRAAPRSSFVNKWTIGGATVILIGVIGFLIAVNQPTGGTATQISQGNAADIPFPEVPRTPLDAAKTKFDTDSALIVDTRSRAEYEQQHITGAISLPLSELSTETPDLPQDAEIITYCT